MTLRTLVCYAFKNSKDSKNKNFNTFIVVKIRFIVYFQFKICFSMLTYLSISLNFV